MNCFTYLESPIGRLLLCCDGEALTGLYMDNPSLPVDGGAWTEDANANPLPEAVRQLRDYFAGSRREFDLPLRLAGTDFQRRVWGGLTEIRYGETWSYGRIGETHRQSKGFASGGAGQRPQSDFDPGALPPRDRRRRLLDRAMAAGWSASAGCWRTRDCNSAADCARRRQYKHDRRAAAIDTIRCSRREVGGHSGSHSHLKGHKSVNVL